MIQRLIGNQNKLPVFSGVISKQGQYRLHPLFWTLQMPDMCSEHTPHAPHPHYLPLQTLE
jgi:hypothetical protein